MFIFLKGIYGIYHIYIYSWNQLDEHLAQLPIGAPEILGETIFHRPRLGQRR
jgi:hypothetical protein